MTLRRGGLPFPLLMDLKIKICGITNRDDALAAVDAGADALGFIFYKPSPRNLSREAAARIIQELPPFVTKVGVFVDSSEDFVRQTLAECGVDTLQFHGSESPEFCTRFGALKVWKAFRIQNRASLQALPAYQTDAWLLDSFAPDKLGGTGAAFNWDLAVEVWMLGRPIILAGGLSPDNVTDVVHRVRPYAVDVSSGVESAPGKKDQAKLRAFIQAARIA